MLLHLSIQNIVLIEALELDFPAGLVVMTGETGAGKSIILDAFGLVLGARSEARLVRSGADKGSVLARFLMPDSAEVSAILGEFEIDVEDEITVRRVVSKDGKSKAFVNGVPANVALLKSLAPYLAEIHGQHDQRGLLDPATHIDHLDAFAGLSADVTKVETAYDVWKQAERDYEQLQQQVEQAVREQDYLQHVVAELQQLNPQVGEEEQLAEKRAMLQHQEKLIDTLKDAYDALTQPNDVVRIIHGAEKILARVPEAIEAQVAPVTEALDRCSVELGEAMEQLQVIVNETQMEGSLDDIEERLFALRGLARKHHKQVDELADYLSEMQQQLKKIDDSEQLLKEANIARKETKKVYEVAANLVSAQRVAAGQSLAQAIGGELAGLKMEKSKVQVELQKLDEDHWHKKGIDRVLFVAQTNPGSPFAPLHKIASGGELSRFMLGFKVVLGALGNQSLTMVFDEIDTGVGGAVAESIGKRLQRLGQHHQVLCITHLPQVASFGNAHLKIQKNQSDDKTTTHVMALSDSERTEEVARMLAGENISNEARAAAEKLIKLAS